MGHWYDKEGNPRHFEGKDGKATTLREARKLGLFPSVTTILGIINKPALNNWWMERVAETAWDTLQAHCIWPWVDSEQAARLRPEPYIWKAIVRDAKQGVSEKADQGSAIHDALELYFGHGRWLHQDAQVGEYLPMCDAVGDLLDKMCGEQEWRAETRFCDEMLGYAGMCDLHSDEWIIDFKTKDGDVGKVRGYEEQAMQLAAYREALAPNARIANVFISRDFDSVETPVKFYEHKDKRAWDKFFGTLFCWQQLKGFGPLGQKIISIDSAQ